ncbi:MAG: GDP-mannose 4,6-dehydratase [Chloroflexota bacterium]|nr:GDP-mannose 4,6-dehydratase [Chloroflexota bacterium]
MRALITGISGFVGSHLAEHLLANTDWEIAGTIYRSDHNIRHLADRLELYPAELSRLPVVEFVLKWAHPDVIFHLAAQSLTSESLHDPWGTLATNISMQVNLLQAMVNLDLHCRILIVGSSEEYGLVGEEDLPVDEEVPLRPMNPYAVSKVTQDMLGLQYHLSHKLDTIRLRPFNHIGPRQRPGFVAPDFAQQIALIEAGSQEPVMRVGNLEPERDFTDVRDVVRAYALLATQGRAGEVYNVGSARSRSIRELLKTLLSFTNVPITVESDPDLMRPSEVPRVVCDYSHLRETTGWKPTSSFEQSLRDVLDYWRKRIAEGDER